jgi:hypothetical protein
MYLRGKSFPLEEEYQLYPYCALRLQFWEMQGSRENIEKLDIRIDYFKGGGLTVDKVATNHLC